MYAYDSALEGLPPVATFNYENVPEEGYLTAVTYGVSEYDNPAWETSRPELMLTVASTDANWGRVLAFIGANMIDECDFGYGEIIHFRNQIAEGSDMTSFFIFAPSILDPEDASDIKVQDRTLNFVAFYPIYEEEAYVIEEIGLQNFMEHPDYDMYSVTRPQITLDKDNAGKWLPPDWKK